MLATIRVMEYRLGDPGAGPGRYQEGQQVGLINHPTVKRIVEGPFTIVGEAPRTPYQWPHQFTWTYHTEDGTEHTANEEKLVPWIEGESQVGQIHSGYAPPMAPNSRFSIGQRVRYRHMMGYDPSKVIVAGPYQVNADTIAYELALNESDNPTTFEIGIENKLELAQNGGKRKTRNKRRKNRRRRTIR
jgi:hypothetical protein